MRASSLKLLESSSAWIGDGTDVGSRVGAVVLIAVRMSEFLETDTTGLDTEQVDVFLNESLLVLKNWHMCSRSLSSWNVSVGQA